MSGQWPPGWDDPERPQGRPTSRTRKPEPGCPRSPRTWRRCPLRSCLAVSRHGSARRSRSRPPRGPASGPASGRAAKGDGRLDAPAGRASPQAGRRGRRPGARARPRTGPRPAARTDGAGNANARYSNRAGTAICARYSGSSSSARSRSALLLVIIALGLSHVQLHRRSSSARPLAWRRGRRRRTAAAASGGQEDRGRAGSATAAPASSAAASLRCSAPDFTVTQTGTSYQGSTLAQQARAQVLAASAGTGSAPRSVCVPSSLDPVDASASTAASPAVLSSTPSGATARLRAQGHRRRACPNWSTGPPTRGRLHTSLPVLATCGWWDSAAPRPGRKSSCRYRSLADRGDLRALGSVVR